jgi:hypothetical protein
MPYPEIQLTPVESSQIAAIGYDAASETLAIRFKGKGDAPGSLYHYAYVSPADWAEFRDAPSIGSYFYKHIKPRPDRHPYTRIPEAGEEEA